ncbi:YjiH family protein [Salinibius halmophilus]|uniref:YjiH family protein n=1 Tax=Salinibius halmophilus TaxID=1853216 RepID=UPI000E66759D|nr:YjiH family protein [Salinibius halmophilus]
MTQLKHWLTFIVPSLIGIALFMTPVPFQDGNTEGVTVAVKIIADALLGKLGESIGLILVSVIILSALLSLMAKLSASVAKHIPNFFGDLFTPSWFWLVVRLVGALFAGLIYWQVGSELVISEYTGGLLLNELMPSLFAVFLFAGLLLPLLLNFGLLEFIGSLMTPIMRPIFKLPGRSAVDCTTSWLGDGTVGVLLTTKQYEQGHYSQKEAAIIATSFSLVSISFTLVIINQVGLSHMTFSMYGAIALANLVAAVIMPRIPPLSRKLNRCVDGSPVPTEGNAQISAITAGKQAALARAAQVRNPLMELVDGLKNSAEMIFGLLPVVLAFGTIALVIAENTPVFTWLGAPFVPLLELLQIPHAQEIGATVVIGFTDMFLPAILVAELDSELTRFVIGALSVTQLIYMSEVGALLLGSKLPLKFIDIVLIFILRTLITLPVIALVAHMVF